MITDPTDAKQAMRLLLRANRPDGDSAALCARLLLVSLPPGAVIAGVSPLPGEPDLLPAWSALHARGHAVLMPETTERGQPLLFRMWHPGDRMQPGRFGTQHPPGPVAVPDIVFVPLLAWDLSLHRLGYGGGYYDRTLSSLPDARRIGFGFESQRVDRVPTGPHDIPLDAIVTETSILELKDRRR